MFAKRPYLLKSSSKSSSDGPQAKTASRSTPRTVPSIENVRSFGWKPDSYEEKSSITVEKKAIKTKRETSSPRDESKQNNSQKSTSKSNLSASPGSDDLSRSSSQSVTAKPTRSQPVPVPNAKSSLTRGVPAKPTSYLSKRSAASSGNSSLKTKHDSNATPPAVAALLAMTSIPKPSSFPKGSRATTKQDAAQKKISAQELMDEWRLEELAADHNSLHESCSPHLEFLLSPPADDEEEEDRMRNSPRSLKKAIDNARLRERSTSSDSIPSLSTDDDASISLSIISSPSSSIYNRHHPASERRERYSSPKSVDAVSDHPLIPLSEPEPEQFPLVYKKRMPLRVKQPTNQSRTSTLKSNLTASLAALRSAARSVSNFAGPSVPPDDYLTSNFFTVPYQSERRPKPIEGVPPPELRRYLNPSRPTTRGTEGGRVGGPMYDFHTQGSQIDHTDLEAVAAAAAAAASIYPAIPATEASSLSQSTYPFYKTHQDGRPITAIRLQTYSRKKTKSSRRNSDNSDEMNVPSEAGPLHNQRAREPRENSDFLRICVLEMRMRRVGKLEAGVPGRARMWLPPRAPVATTNSSSQSAVERYQESKKKWEATTIEY